MNSKTNHFLNLFLIFGVCVVFSILISNEVYAACLSVPVGGTYTINNTATGGTGGCAFAGTVDGVDNGGIIIDADQTLTINAGQTIVWSPGSSITVNGSIAINKSGGAQLRKTYLWMTDADSDGYPASSTQVAQDTAPTNGRRRSVLTNFTYVSGCTYDYNDSSNTVYPGTTCGTGYECGTNATDGSCTAVSAGENGLAVCKRCNGVSTSPVNITDNTQDAEGTYTCSGTCQACQSGICGNTTNFCATGGTITTSGGYTIHTFTSNGTFTPNGAGNVEYLVVGGGGGGGCSNQSSRGAGGGAGGVLTGTGFAVTAQAYTVTVGAGATSIGNNALQGNNGGNSTFSTITANGGGGGGGTTAGAIGSAGGSGGGGSGRSYAGGSGVSGQGYNGGQGDPSVNSYDSWHGGGGGGAGGAGAQGLVDSGCAAGGIGIQSSITGTPTYYAGGGGGSWGGAGGNGGGGSGYVNGGGGAGAANTGGGGGGSGGAGGSGIVILRYPTP